ncbi:MAG: Ig-like domain-containing protein [Gemmatimonadaceae bacterium]
MRVDARRAIWAVAAAVLCVACSPETIQTTVGEGGFRLPSTTLRVGDTMTIEGGVRFNNGTFVPDTSARFTASPPSVATIDNMSGLLTAHNAGVTTVTAILRGQVTIDTSLVVTQ